MYRSTPAPALSHVGSLASITSCKVRVLLCELSDDKDNTDPSNHRLDVLTDPWCGDFNSYLHSRDELGTMKIVEWWGVSTRPYTPESHQINNATVEFKLIPSLGISSLGLPPYHGIVRLK